MTNFAGIVLDTYDDPNGEVLREIVPDPSNIPVFVKEAHRLTDEQAGAIPDDGYALVLVKEGQKIHKYATVDKGNTALSVMYLLKQAHLLPSVAVKVAARNLIEACVRHDLAVPDQLKIAAHTGISGVSGKAQQPFLRKSLNAALEKQLEYPVPEPPKETTINPQLGRGGVEDDVKKRVNMAGTPGSNFLEAPPFSLKERNQDDHVKTAQAPHGYQLHEMNKRHPTTTGKRGMLIELRAADAEKGGYGSHTLADPETTAAHWKARAAAHIKEQAAKVKTAAPADAETMALLNADAETMKQNWRTSPYVDVADWEPGATLEKQASVQERTLLRGKYPVDSYGQVKTAEAYFTEYKRQFHPRERREYCIKLAERMGELNIDVSEDIAKYASNGYGADVEAYVSFRKSHVAEEYHPALDTLLEKQAMVSPETFAEALCDFDETTNLNYQWDSRIPDPWASTFGDSHEKIAADEWTWDEQGVRIDEDMLQRLSINSRPMVENSFGANYADELAKSPKAFFEALPMPNKLVLGRLAMSADVSGDGEK